MTKTRKSISLVAVVLILIALPMVAQITNPLTFKTTFPFYVGNAKMPAGEYRVSQPGLEEGLLLIESVSGSHSAFVEIDATTTDQPHPQTDITFNRYHNIDFLNAVWVQGQNSGMQVEPSKYEQSVAKTATPEKHSVSVKNRN
jgi:hypothetical protein